MDEDKKTIIWSAIRGTRRTDDIVGLKDGPCVVIKKNADGKYHRTNE